MQEVIGIRIFCFFLYLEEESKKDIQKLNFKNGAKYEGQLKDAKMDGNGTYTASMQENLRMVNLMVLVLVIFRVEAYMRESGNMV